MTESILSPTFLFRFCVPFRKTTFPKSLDLERAKPKALGTKHTLPSFGELEDRPLFAELRGGWSAEGLRFHLRVEGKKQLPWCRSTRLEDSDGLHLFLDTRDSQDIHRANRFCHHFVFLPHGGGRTTKEPLARWLPINRARENPREVDSNELGIAASSNVKGYELQAVIPAAALTGFDPSEHPRLGFSYAVVDRELGWQTLSTGPEFPLMDDPTLWGSLELV